MFKVKVRAFGNIDFERMALGRGVRGVWVYSDQAMLCGHMKYSCKASFCREGYALDRG
jgi:hypothetical protein